MTRRELQRAKLSEHDIQAGIMDYLRLRGVFFWRNNSGAFKIGDRYVRAGAKGSPDILGIMPDGTGRLLAIEVKRPGARTTPDQQEFLDAVTRHGGVAIVAHSLDELIDQLYKNKTHTS